LMLGSGCGYLMLGSTTVAALQRLNSTKLTLK
jgi:hypothetical protein